MSLPGAEGRASAAEIDDLSLVHPSTASTHVGEPRPSRAGTGTLARAASHLTFASIAAMMLISGMTLISLGVPYASAGGNFLTKIHPATRSFQAIRIHVNRELADLELGLDAAMARLKPGGRLAVISFHSLEDRIVKQFMARHAKAPPANRRMPVEVAFTPALRLLGGAQKAGDAELSANPRARSAVLRVAERLPEAA